MDKATRRALKHLSYVPRFRDHTIHYRTNVLFGKTKVPFPSRAPAPSSQGACCPSSQPPRLPSGSRGVVHTQCHRPEPCGPSAQGPSGIPREYLGIRCIALAVAMCGYGEGWGHAAHHVPAPLQQRHPHQRPAALHLLTRRHQGHRHQGPGTPPPPTHTHTYTHAHTRYRVIPALDGPHAAAYGLRVPAFVRLSQRVCAPVIFTSPLCKAHGLWVRPGRGRGRACRAPETCATRSWHSSRHSTRCRCVFAQQVVQSEALHINE